MSTPNLKNLGFSFVTKRDLKTIFLFTSLKFYIWDIWKSIFNACLYLSKCREKRPLMWVKNKKVFLLLLKFIDLDQGLRTRGSFWSQNQLERVKRSWTIKIMYRNQKRTKRWSQPKKLYLWSQVWIFSTWVLINCGTSFYLSSMIIWKLM